MPRLLADLFCPEFFVADERLRPLPVFVDTVTLPALVGGVRVLRVRLTTGDFSGDDEARLDFDTAATAADRDGLVTGVACLDDEGVVCWPALDPDEPRDLVPAAFTFVPDLGDVVFEYLVTTTDTPLLGEEGDVVRVAAGDVAVTVRLRFGVG